MPTTPKSIPGIKHNGGRCRERSIQLEPFTRGTAEMEDIIILQVVSMTNMTWLSKHQRVCEELFRAEGKHR